MTMVIDLNLRLVLHEMFQWINLGQVHMLKQIGSICFKFVELFHLISNLFLDVWHTFHPAFITVGDHSQLAKFIDKKLLTYSIEEQEKAIVLGELEQLHFVELVNGVINLSFFENIWIA